MSDESMDQTMRRILDGAYELRDTNEEEVSPTFHRLPERTLVDYYRVIKRPMSLIKVARNLQHKRYKRFSEFIRDMAQIPHNAKTYNERESLIYNHAVIFENYVRDELAKLRTMGRFSEKELRFPNLGALPDEVNDDDEDAEPSEDDDDDEDETYTSSRRGRPRRSTVIKRQQQQQEEEDQAAQSLNDERRKKRGRPPTVDRPHEHRIKAVMRGVRKEKEPRTNRILYQEFEKLLDPKTHPDYYEQITTPIALDYIRKQIKQRKYKSMEAFLADMDLMFNNAKTYNMEGSQIYMDAQHLQQVTAQLAEEEIKKPDSAYQDLESNSKTSRLPLDSVEHRGETYRVGDWVHINNINDPSKPTIGQIFRIWRASDNQNYINVCWYYRPEQTVHRYDKLFYENEVVKSGQYRDHLVDEILEKCFVMFVTKYQRGRPANIGDRSVYCCESRYNETEKTFNKIRTWKACIPDEVRSEDYEMDMFERTHMLRRVISPIKHLLPDNAREDDPIPQAKTGAKNAPPIVGAVYKRPYDPEDPPEQPTDETADIGTPRQPVTSKRHSGSFSQSANPQSSNNSTRQYVRQPQPYLPPGGGTPPVKGTVNAAAVTPGGYAQQGTSAPLHLGSGQHAMYHPHSQATLPPSRGYVAPAAAASYMPPPPNSVFALPQGTQRLLPERQLGDKVARASNGDMLWFTTPPVYVRQRVANIEAEGIRFRFKREREREREGEGEGEGDGEDGGGEQESEDEQEMHAPRAPLGHSAKYLAWKAAKRAKVA